MVAGAIIVLFKTGIKLDIVFFISLFIHIPILKWRQMIHVGNILEPTNYHLHLFQLFVYTQFTLVDALLYFCVALYFKIWYQNILRYRGAGLGSQHTRHKIQDLYNLTPSLSMILHSLHCLSLTYNFIESNISIVYFNHIFKINTNTHFYGCTCRRLSNIVFYIRIQASIDYEHSVYISKGSKIGHGVGCRLHIGILFC